MSTIRFLTGITPSGTPHLGNYAGMLRPAIAASRSREVENFYFLADYHALIKCQDPARVQRSTIEIAASWLAAGLDPEHVTFYRQSDIPEIPELCWLLTCVTGKGLLNRAHAYKAAVDKNHADGAETDDGVTAGLFMYPVLMAADILAFNAHKVPVGRDQVQHIEMARDMASSFNHIYGGEFFTLPEAQVEDNVATLPGLDGRKMSKSYNNTIPLFSTREQLRKLIGSITTDSRTPGEPKEVEGSALFQIYQGFASEEETEALRHQYAEGIAWGDAKQQLFERIDRELGPMRERYEHLVAHPGELEDILQAGATKARRETLPLIRELRSAVGLRSLAQAPVAAKAKAAKQALPQFKQYREADGKFYFKLVAADGQLLLQSLGFDAPKEAGQAIGQLQREGEAALSALQSRLQPADAQLVLAALQQLRDASE
ncbi:MULTISPECIES: tryptophan--tRNA ligase [Delftia]|uniref:Tryptophan--tRNA ligase n=1 Tax=Delftia lacustris TaxID=558537 RepID=A0A7T3DE36_9BURK|nr:MULTISPECIES: tryptophan--tRNA ligase [Delftia]EPD46334.1 tryptophan-tRNA ligase [Delftia acidovorans CCUG 15835]KAA9165943.1 tryptophan--tRNA ligase [Delftia sp. BR1]QPS80929.1 tryptophan--tRNA ligase [Delftia lacustris]